MSTLSNGTGQNADSTSFIAIFIQWKLLCQTFQQIEIDVYY